MHSKRLVCLLLVIVMVATFGLQSSLAAAEYAKQINHETGETIDSKIITDNNRWRIVETCDNNTMTLLVSETMDNKACTVNYTIGDRNDRDNNTNLSVETIRNKCSVITLAESNLSFFNENSENQEYNVKGIDKDFIEVYDSNCELFAYMVTILDDNNNSVGFMTIGAFDSDHSLYDIYLNSEVIDFIHSLAKQNARIIFSPPVDYYVEKNGNYYLLELNEKIKIDVSDSFYSNRDLKDIIYNDLKSKKHEDHSASILDHEGQDFSILTSERVSLRNPLISNFVPVTDGTNTYYGGNQNWYGTSTKRNRGCGPVAAANITSYFARKTGTYYNNLYRPSSLTKSNFVKHMDDLYATIQPGVLGTWWSRFNNGVENFTANRGAPLNRVIDNSSFTVGNTSNYIKAGLNRDSPVAILNMQPAGSYEYKAHWMVVTEFIVNSSGQRFIRVSTWGQYRLISYDTWFASTRIYGGGLVYFR